MSGHSKWSTIKRKKGAADTKRGQAFTRLANAITLAAKEGGGDPTANFNLRLTIDRARGVNMPNANIERAVKRGTGELAGEKAPEQIRYEAYGPGGVALLLDCLTDNRNRTVSDVRSTITKRGGSLGESGSVGYLFTEKGVITFRRDSVDADELMLAAIDAGADDVEVEDEVVEVVTGKQNFKKVKDALDAAGYQPESAELANIATVTVAVTDQQVANKVVALLAELEELDDVVSVSTNADIEPDLVSG
jgi:YebC/PmpR family DNA-binding regulatory protein